MPVAQEVVISIEDDDGHTSTMSIRIPNATANADSVAFAADMATLVDAVIDGVITRIGLSQTVTLPGGLKSAVLAQAKRERGATFIYTSNAGFLFRHRLPTFKASLINAGGNTVDLTDGDVDALVDAMTDGITPVATLVEPSEHRDDDLVAISSAVETFNSSRG